MSIYGYMIETNLKSSIDNDFKSKGKKSLSDFKKEKISKEVLNKYKQNAKFLRHIDPKDNGYLFLDKNNIVAVVSVSKVEKDGNEYNWITAIEVSKEYRGYGLGIQLLDLSVKELKGNALTVAIDNEVAIRMYKKYGFIISKQSMEDVKAKRKTVYFMYLPKVLPD